MNEHTLSPGGNTPQPTTGIAGQSSAIDIEKLAEKIYQLLRLEARLARARAQTRGPRR